LLATYEIDSHLCKNEHQLLAKNKNLKLSLADD
jgi:hypothetical protein